MSKWGGRLSKVGLAAVKGGRRLQQVAHEAETAPLAVPSPSAPPEPEVDARLTPQQGLLLVRYIVGRLLLAKLELIFLFKYGLLVLGVGLVLLDVPWPYTAALVVLFLLAAALQWLVTRIVRRLAAVDRLSALDALAQDAVTLWWPNLKRELIRIGVSPRPWSLLRRRSALGGIEWGRVLPRRQWHEARQVLARAAGAPPTAGPTDRVAANRHPEAGATRPDLVD